MRGPFDAWRRSPWLWAAPLGFCVINLLGLMVYQTFYFGEVDRLVKNRQDGERILAERQAESERVDEFLARADAQDVAIERLYDEYFQNEARRFTDAIREVQTLARDAGLDPTSFSYPQRTLKDSGGLVERGIQFSVQGSYQQLRTFINFLELTDQFLTLNSISLSEAGPDRLSIRFQLSTIFTTAGRQSRGEESGSGEEPNA